MQNDGKTSITVYRPLMERLNAFLDELRGRAGKRPDRYPEALRKGKVSHGDALNWLLDAYYKEAGRKRRAMQKRVLRRKQAPSGAV